MGSDPTDWVRYPLLTAMLAPALFMGATATLLLNANQRMGRIMDRLRADLRDAHRLGAETDYAILRRRGHTMLRAIRLLYLALCFFVGTSLAVAVDGVLGLHQPLLPTLLAGSGVFLMLLASFDMWREAGMAVRWMDVVLEEEARRAAARQR